jgi:hypothetical protein
MVDARMLMSVLVFWMPMPTFANSTFDKKSSVVDQFPDPHWIRIQWLWGSGLI